MGYRDQVACVHWPCYYGLFACKAWVGQRCLIKSEVPYRLVILDEKNGLLGHAGNDADAKDR
jgi:hypothetical protein